MEKDERIRLFDARAGDKFLDVQLVGYQLPSQHRIGDVMPSDVEIFSMIGSLVGTATWIDCVEAYAIRSF